MATKYERIPVKVCDECGETADVVGVIHSWDIREPTLFKGDLCKRDAAEMLSSWIEKPNKRKPTIPKTGVRKLDEKEELIRQGLLDPEK